jgi:hypothetical protein
MEYIIISKIRNQLDNKKHNDKYNKINFHRDGINRVMRAAVRNEGE